MIGTREKGMSSVLVRRGCRTLLLSVVFAAMFVCTASAHAKSREPRIGYPESEFKRLDTFEGHSLDKADKLFAKNDYRQAAASYETFLQEFPDSRATPYVILQKGRCFQKGNKRNAAIKIYTEVLDFFPNRVDYAAPAIFFIGQSHWENGDIDKALRVWTRMAKDKGYRKHALAAGALNKLADGLCRKKRGGDALPFYRQVAVDFRRTNARESRHAMDRAVAMYLRGLNEPALRTFYRDVAGFDQRPWPVKGDPLKHRGYWDQVVRAVQTHGKFGTDKKQEHDQYFSYWAGQMSGKFPKWDDFHITRIGFLKACDRNAAKWAQRLDGQFKSGGSTTDADRIVKWIGVFAGKNKAKVEEYFGNLKLDALKNDALIRLTHILLGVKGREKQAKHVFRHIRLKKVSDHDKRHKLISPFWHRDGQMVRDVCMAYANAWEGKSVLLDYYLDKHDAKNGVPLADQLAAQAKYASSATYRKAELLFRTRQFKLAVPAYRQSNCEPRSLYRIAECFEGMGDRKRAINQLREIENFFKKESPNAVMCIAKVHKRSGDKRRQEAVLREIMTKYAGSGQSRGAHEMLEAMGVRRIKGGVNVER